jgi:hypothetical protein
MSMIVTDSKWQAVLQPRDVMDSCVMDALTRCVHVMVKLIYSEYTRKVSAKAYFFVEVTCYIKKGRHNNANVHKLKVYYYVIISVLLNLSFLHYPFPRLTGPKLAI